MKLRMARNSAFAVLLRSPWWISGAIALAVGLLSWNLLAHPLRVVGLLSGLPFVVIAGLAARRQWHLPSTTRVTETRAALATTAWPTFAVLLEQSFRRDGYAVNLGKTSPADFTLERRGRRMVVCARRWKSAHTGLEPLRALQAARDAAEAPDALYIGLGPLNDAARLFANENRIAVWHAPELAHALRGLPLPDSAGR